MRRLLAVLAIATAALAMGATADAAAPLVFNTPGFESPVRGGPDELLFLGGAGFSQGDRVVYRSFRENDEPNAHPEEVPTQSTRDLGTASVLKVGDPPYSLTILLPQVLSADVMYRFWVVNSSSEWSKPFTINDPRPLWVSPGFVYATVDTADLGRRIRIMGRNLQPSTGAAALQVQLQGTHSYVLSAVQTPGPPTASQAYVLEAKLPQRIEPGTYTVRVSRQGRAWISLPAQKLTVLPDPGPSPRFDISSASLGGCRPNDDSDDSDCLQKALEAARQAGGGTIRIPPGTWSVDRSTASGETAFELSRGIRLEGAGADKTTLTRRVVPGRKPDNRPLILLEGDNSVTGLKFMDEQRFTSFNDARPVLMLGHRWDDPRARDGTVPDIVRNIVISRNVFRRVGMGAIDGGLPIQRLLITHNDFGGYARGLEFPGTGHSLRVLFRIEDAVIRNNRFIPGSFVDRPIDQGVLATGMGASTRVDFSANEADGTSTEALQDPTDPHGWRAAFFWNMHDSSEMLLVADNHISCPGDKVGDGEAIAFDRSGEKFAYPQVQQITASTPDSITVTGDLLPPPPQWAGAPNSYYVGHWMQILGGPGLGQARRIVSYHPAGNHATVFQVEPAWDVLPSPEEARVVVARMFWQAYVVGNEIVQSAPLCTKSNPSGPHGGEITLWAPTADSVVEANRLFDTNGVGFTQGYQAKTPSCPTCGTDVGMQTGLEIRANLIQGEYDWSSDCSWSGIHGTFGASPTPEAPPPTVSFGVQVTHNTVEHSDGLRGGAIDILPTWTPGPPPYNWSVIDNLIIAHNAIRDIEGSAPKVVCKTGQRKRIGINLEGGGDVTGTVLYKNSCERIDTPLADTARGTLRSCDNSGDGRCECGTTPR